MKKIIFFSFFALLLTFSACTHTENSNNSDQNLNQEETISEFFTLIDDDKLDDALEMAASSVEDMYKQVWIANFSSLDSVELKDVHALTEEGENAYQVDLEIKLKEGANTYRWQEDELNLLLFILVQEDGKWKIARIANGVVDE